MRIKSDAKSSRSFALSGSKAEHPRFAIPTPNRGNLFRSQLRLLSKHVVYTEFFGVADSSAAFGVGMTRTIEQDDPENFSANLKPASHALYAARLKPRPCNARFIYQRAI
jgi:hypothetical protein